MLDVYHLILTNMQVDAINFLLIFLLTLFNREGNMFPRVLVTCLMPEVVKLEF